MTKLTARRTMLTTSGLGLALLIAGCSGNSGAGEPTERSSEPPAPSESGSTDGPSTDPSTTSPDSPEASDSPESSPSSSSAGAGEQTKVTIGEKFSDPDTEDKIEIVAAIRNFASDEMADDIADGGEVVLVQVKVTPGQKFGGAVSEGSFEISWDDGADFWNNKTRLVEDELKAADLELFDRIARRDGGSKSGWIAYVAKEKSDSYRLEYTRDAAKIIGQDKTIKEFSKQLDIPAS